jgi:hypothetical protein
MAGCSWSCPSSSTAPNPKGTYGWSRVGRSYRSLSDAIGALEAAGASGQSAGRMTRPVWWTFLRSSVVCSFRVAVCRRGGRPEEAERRRAGRGGARGLVFVDPVRGPEAVLPKGVMARMGGGLGSPGPKPGNLSLPFPLVNRGAPGPVRDQPPSGADTGTTQPARRVPPAARRRRSGFLGRIS